MNFAEIPIVALALIRTFGDQAFARAADHAEAARQAEDFLTARQWLHIAEIIRNEQALYAEEHDAEPADTQQPEHGRWTACAGRWLRMHLLLAQRPHASWEPFGTELEPWASMDWSGGHQGQGGPMMGAHH